MDKTQTVETIKMLKPDWDIEKLVIENSFKGRSKKGKINFVKFSYENKKYFLEVSDLEQEIVALD